MPRPIVDGTHRLALRVRAEDEARLMPAVALTHTDMTDFILRHALDAARKVIDQAEHVTLSERDTLRVLDAQEYASTPNAKLLGVARRELDVPAPDALDRVRAVRPRAIETGEQLKYVLDLRC